MSAWPTWPRVGSQAVNGVAELHTELLKQTVLRDFYELYPEKFFNVTNGVTPRRWVALSNPRLTDLITSRIGDRWISRPEDLRGLEILADDPGFQEEWQRVKLENKRQLAGLIQEQTGIVVDPGSLFDIQVKRLHEYKRQHLNVLHVITLYNRLEAQSRRRDAAADRDLRGKGRSGLFHGQVDHQADQLGGRGGQQRPGRGRPPQGGLLSRTSMSRTAQSIYPAADLSEQISTAGKEASGTGNMKFSLNGALTIGTLDGANVEIREEVGAENFFLFGLTAEEVYRLNAQGYRPEDYYHSNEDLAGSDRPDPFRILFSRRPGSFQTPGGFPVIRRSLPAPGGLSVLRGLPGRSGAGLPDRNRWTTMSILNMARMGKFSSDRSIREYNEKIWKVKPL